MPSVTARLVLPVVAGRVFPLKLSPVEKAGFFFAFRLSPHPSRFAVQFDHLSLDAMTTRAFDPDFFRSLLENGAGEVHCRPWGRICLWSLSDQHLTGSNPFHDVGHFIPSVRCLVRLPPSADHSLGVPLKVAEQARNRRQ